MASKPLLTPTTHGDHMMYVSTWTAFFASARADGNAPATSTRSTGGRTLSLYLPYAVTPAWGSPLFMRLHGTLLQGFMFKTNIPSEKFRVSVFCLLSCLTEKMLALWCDLQKQTAQPHTKSNEIKARTLRRG